MNRPDHADVLGRCPRCGGPLLEWGTEIRTRVLDCPSCRIAAVLAAARSREGAGHPTPAPAGPSVAGRIAVALLVLALGALAWLFFAGH